MEFKTLSGTIGAIIGVVATIPLAFWVLLGMMAIDILSGVSRAWADKSLDSDIGRRGINKKAQTWFIVIGALGIERILPTLVPGLEIPLSQALAGAYAVMEFLSIAENAAATGRGIPKWLQDALKEKLS